MTQFQYRRLTAHDAEVWLSLRQEGARDFPLGFLVTAEEAAQMSLARARERMQGGGMRGIDADGALIGFCGYNPNWLSRTKHRAEIGPLYVSAAFHGTGAAQALMQGVIAEARAEGLAQLELFVDSENHRAIAFYERNGFARVATIPDSVRIDGRSRDDHFYALRLDD